MKTVYLDEGSRSIADLMELEEGDQQAISGLPDSKGLPMYLVTRISVPRESRGKGVGSKLLREILRDADEEGVVLTGWVSPSGGMTKKQLNDWYLREGYQKVKGSQLLVRYPKGT